MSSATATATGPHSHCRLHHPGNPQQAEVKGKAQEELGQGDGQENQGEQEQH